MDPRIRLTDELLAQLGGSRSRVTSATAPAASVILVRDTEHAPEFYLQIRSATMVFAGGRPAFPGGRIDPADTQPISRWSGPDLDWWATELGTDRTAALAVVCAAVRETFEESGYLLASGSDGTPLVELDSDDWREDREALARHRISLAELLARRELVLRSDRLRPWSVWVTPEFEPRRYHTWFLVAECPVGQHVLGVSGESTTSHWITAEQAIRSADAGTLALLPPQYCSFLQLLRHSGIDEVLTRRPPMSEIRPVLATDDAGAYLELPAELVELGIRAERQLHAHSDQEVTR
ncbi:NUDIX hydrolase [Gordonia polyisoprenivorans]|uniref:NUDIX hydrolase n=1 Tax=Gordonia polyisoprenivorans TaxID=84595 RepID=UPI000B99DB6B|nr:NUDIX domain-containing protein [Gordonia polyisoprenivorans]OZC29526.1 NUDIX domain-containing protein [Gordonia polyisoprenivorans]WCB38973.1 NUDIX domain-containing protein [Gordonia polyisoprenivorans]